MTTKLTLTVNEKIIYSAKQYAKKKGKSLSHIVENYLISITSETNDDTISPKILKLMGVIKLSENFNYKKKLRNMLLKKHL